MIADRLTTAAQLTTQLGHGLRTLTLQTIVGLDNPALSGRQSLHLGLERLLHLMHQKTAQQPRTRTGLPLPVPDLPLLCLLCLLQLHRLPYLAGDGHTGVGGKGSPRAPDQAQDRSPQTDTPLVHAFPYSPGTCATADEQQHGPDPRADTMSRSRLLASPAWACRNRLATFSVAYGRMGHGVSPFCCWSSRLAQRRKSRNAISMEKTAGSRLRDCLLHTTHGLNWTTDGGLNSPLQNCCAIPPGNRYYLRPWPGFQRARLAPFPAGRR